MDKLESTDAFVVVDLEGADHAYGVVRLAPKILVDGASLLARSVTYQFALFEQKVSGASAGINAKPGGRDAAVRAFIAELLPRVESGELSLDAGKGVEPSDLEPLSAVDTRNHLSRNGHAPFTAVSIVAAADAVAGGLEGRSVAMEGFDATGPVAIATARQLEARGARIMTVATASGSARATGGAFDAEMLSAAFAEHGSDMVEHLGVETTKPWTVLAAEADLLVAGSKAGAITHDNAGSVTARAVVPIGRVPVTAKALAMLRRAGTTVVPDFISLAGPGFAAWPADGSPSSPDDVIPTIDRSVREVLREAMRHEDGPLLASCYQAEAFLRTWQDQPPFGRPLA